MLKHLMIASAVAAMASAPVLAQDNTGRNQRVIIQNDRGGVSTIDRNVQGRLGNRSIDSEITGPGGRTFNRQVDRVWDPETQTFTRRVIRTNPDGTQRVIEGQTQRLGKGQFRNDRRVINRNGRQFRDGRNITIQRD